MREEATVLTDSASPRRLATDVRENPISRVRLTPMQKLTRAHLAVSQRPAAMAAIGDATLRVVSSLATQLKMAVRCTPSLSPATLHPLTHLASRSLFAIFELGGEALGVLELDALGTSALIGQITGSNEPIAMPLKLSAIEEAALGWVVLSALAELRNEAAFAAFSARLLTLTMDRGEVLKLVDGRRRHVAVQLALNLGGTNSLARVLVPALWLQSKFDLLPLEQAPEAMKEVLSATLPFACVMGGALLSSADARALAPGDVVLFDGVRNAGAQLCGVGRLIGPSFELRGNFTNEGFSITRSIERPTQESPMSIDPTVPVEVEIELTRLRMPLHQLGTVRPGAVIPLCINAAQHVVIRIGDRAVAKAELVEIEGEIGARVVSML